jgi:DNA-binding response OmpR family regulator
MGRKSRLKAKPALGRVLIVEDDPVLALALEETLRVKCSCDVVICPSMETTMAELEAQLPDAMVIDIHLADRDDGWALAELTSLIDTRRPRIVFSTGVPQEIPEEIAEIGAVFEKPYDPTVLVEVLCGEERRGLFARFRGTKG